MGDYFKNIEMFKKLGFETCSQWILYEDSFQQFFNWLAEHIKDENILSENEIQEAEDLKKSGEFLYGNELELQRKSLNENFPSILDLNEYDVAQLEEEIKCLSEAEKMYEELVKDMESTKTNGNRDLKRLEANRNELDNHEKDAYQNSVQKAKIVQELQKQNWKLCSELNECFVKSQTPPLLIHEMPFDQYCQKCDSFMQYLTLYMEDNFNILDYLETDEIEIGDTQTNIRLEKMRLLIFRSELKYVKNKMKCLAMQQMIDDLDINQIHHGSLSQLKKETHDLKIMNTHNCETRYEYLMECLKNQLVEITQQQVEMVLFENSKQKFERGKTRLENVKYHFNIVSEALSNAEFLWMLVQLDLEKVKSNFNNTDQLFEENKKCVKRIESMQILSQSESLNNLKEDFIKKMFEILSQNVPLNKICTTKTCLYEYEKFCRSSKYIIEGVLYHKYYGNVLDTVKILDSLEKILLVYVFNAPVNRPMLENVKYLKSVFNAKKNKKYIESYTKSFRIQFSDNILERIKSDRLWRYKQNLWIWFLTEPKKVLSAIEEASKYASSIPAVKMKFAGLKRM